MKTFLHEVAEDLYARYGEGLSERAILFPSRRARLFFVDALTGIAGRPMWQPRWVTVDDLTTEISGLRTGDRVRLIPELYKIYSEYHAEPFDKFYFWGDMLLTDFDTIDKYRIDAAMLFRNISEIKEIEADISYLTPAQLQILRFWSTLADETDLSEEKRRFLAIWKTLGPVYARFRERLSELGIAYNGMVQRAAADRIRGEGYAFPEARQYVVAGFNALSECEKQLFRFLSTAAETDFYWDYDSYYKDRPEQEAGMFVRENVVQFPPRGDVSHDNMERPKELTAVAAVSNAVQCKHAAAILRELAARGPLDKRTAVVLTDENLLLPLLYALPPEIGKVNVTMGYPLRASLAYTFVERLVELQAHRRTKGAGCTFYHADAVGILAHPYVADSDARETRAMQDEIVRERRISVDAAWLGRNDLLRMIFSPAAAWRELSDWLLRVVAAVARTPYEGDDRRQRVEFLAVISEEISKLRNSLDECDIELTTEVYTSLLRRHLQTVRIPYEGEPLEGVQVMGILETRNLDFENVVLLSMNDDNFPGNHMAQASFVPYNLRAAYGLPTPEHHEGVYASISTASCSAPGGCGCSTARTPTTNRRANRAATSTSSTTRADFPSGRSRWVWMSTSPRPIRSRWPRTRGSCSVSDASPTQNRRPRSRRRLSSAMWPVPCGSIFTPWRVSRPTTRSPRRSTPRCSARSFTPRCRNSMPGSWARRTPARPCGR